MVILAQTQQLLLLKLNCRHALLFEDMTGDYNIPLVVNAKSVREFDDGLTRGIYISTWKPLYSFNEICMSAAEETSYITPCSFIWFQVGR